MMKAFDNTLVEIFNILVKNDDEFYGYSLFDNESNDEDDLRETIYYKNGIEIRVCHDWGYYEVLGLDTKDFKNLRESYRNYVKLKRGLVKGGFTEEENEDEEDWDDIDEGYSSNCHCDTYGICGGTSCPQYWQCHSK